MSRADIYNAPPTVPLETPTERWCGSRRPITRRPFAPGRAILREGATDDRLYRIESGAVELCMSRNGMQSITIARLGPGEFFGDLSVFDGGVSSVTALAVTRTWIIAFDRTDIETMLVQEPALAVQLLRGLVGRIRRMDELLREHTPPNPNELIDDTVTFGDHLADLVARLGGSWGFVVGFLLLYMAWMLVNLGSDAIDPYPFSFLNLALSLVAALQAPIIMMSQNRQDARDRIRGELGYQASLRTEVGIQELLRRVEAIEDLQEHSCARDAGSEPLAL